VVSDKRWVILINTITSRELMESSFVFGFGIIHILLCVCPSSLTQINYNVFQFHCLINILYIKPCSAVITCISFCLRGSVISTNR